MTYLKILTFNLFNRVCLTLSRTHSLYKIAIQNVCLIYMKKKLNSKPSLRNTHVKTDGKCINFLNFRYFCFVLFCFCRVTDVFNMRKLSGRRLKRNLFPIFIFLDM